MPPIHPRQLTSDNTSGACPEALAAIVAANADHAPSYGADPWTARAEALIRQLLGRDDAQVFLVSTGTAANSLALASICPPHGLVACHASAHVLHDECGAPGFFGHGLRLRGLPGAHGLIDADAVERFAGTGNVHTGRLAALSLTMLSEMGAAYSLDRLRALRDIARRGGLKIHVDGARFANAVAGLNVAPAAIIDAAGIDVLSLGGTKNGMIGVEAVVILDPVAARDFAYRRKQAGQLASKHRFLAAQWVGVLASGAWLRHAAHANAMADDLARALTARGLPPVHPRHGNEVFISLPMPAQGRLRERGWTVHTDAAWGGTRLVCSWDTAPADVAAFLADLP